MESTMSRQDGGNTGRLLRGALAGVIAGAVASFAMDRVQAAVTALASSDDSGEQQEPATEQAADGVAQVLTGSEVASLDKPLAGQAMHYALGIGLGAAYGIAAEFRPSITAGFGTAFGVGVATLLDEGMVPALGLGKPLWKATLTSNLYGYASHLVFGGVTELVRRQVAGTLEA